MKNLLLIAALAAPASLHAQTTLVACGYHNLDFVLEQVDTSWWSWQPNNDAMWLWNQYVDIYRYRATNGTWGHNSVDEFAGFPSNNDLNATWGTSWGPGTLALTISTWNCQCCRLLESDIAFNPAYSWTTDPVAAETNPSLIYYTSVLLHELGHSWGEQTINENYDYGVPTVMHAYYGNAVQGRLALHRSDAYLLRRQYASQRGALPRTNMGVFSQYPSLGLRNTTAAARVAQGGQLAVRNLTVENPGTTAVANAHVRLYLSTNRTISTADRLIGDWYWNTFNAESWGVYDLTGTVPLTTPLGSYWVGALVTINGYATDDLWHDDTTYLFQQVIVDPRPCADDRFEPNDARASAAAIPTGSHTGLQICQGNDDWYRITVPAGNRLDVAIQFANVNGDLDLELYDAAGTLIDGSYSVGDGELVQLPNATVTGSWYARVYGFLGAQNTYSLQADVTVNASCTFRNGSGINPTGYTCATLPVLGSNWQPQIGVAPGTATTLIGVGMAPDPGTPLAGGQLLIQSTFAVFSSPTGTYSIFVPHSSSFLGTRLYSQGFRVEAVGGTPVLIPLNAQDLRFGL